MSDTNFKANVEVNQQYSCSVPGCERNREGLSKYCHKHRMKHQKYGTPTPTPVMGVGNHRHYKRELEYAHELIIKNSDTKPVQAAVKLLGQWINGCRGGLDLPGARLISLISAEGKELSILSELASVYIYALDVKHQSHKELTYSLANALYLYVPVPYRTMYSSSGKRYTKPVIKMGSIDRQVIGKYILEELGIFLENIRKHFAASEQQHTSLKRQMSDPL